MTGYWSGKKNPALSERNRKAVGEKNGMWKDDGVTYFTLHNWIRRRKGTPEKCEVCGKENKPGKDGRSTIYWTNISGKYKRELGDYMARCSGCNQRDGIPINKKFEIPDRWLKKGFLG